MRRVLVLVLVLQHFQELTRTSCSLEATSAVEKETNGVGEEVTSRACARAREPRSARKLKADFPRQALA